MTIELISHDSTNRASCNSQIEKWLASSQLDTVLTDRLNQLTEVFAPDSSLSSFDQNPWQTEMSVLPLPLTYLKARDPASAPNACLEFKEQQKILGEPSWALHFQDSMHFRQYDEYKGFSVLPTTIKPTTPFDSYSWSNSARNLVAINELDTLALSSESPHSGALRSEALVDDRESTNSSPEDDVPSDRDLDIRSTVTPVTTFSPSSFSHTMSRSNSSYSTLNSVGRSTSACTYCPLSPDQYGQTEPVAVDTGVASQTMSEPEARNSWLNWLRSHDTTSSPGIFKSVLQDGQLNTDLTGLGLTWNTSTESSYQGTLPDNGASSVSLPNAYSFANQIAKKVRVLKHNDSLTLKPSDLWGPSADVHVSELPFPDTIHEARELSSLERAQVPIKEATSTFSQSMLESHHPRASTYSKACPAKGSYALQCNETRPSDRQSSSRSQRRACDDFLIRSKLAGKSYKDIRVEGRFTEAESTLRGRFRTLTKRKEQRVRKPQWQEKDVSCFFFFFQLSGHQSLRTCQINILACARSSFSSRPSTRLWRICRM